MKTTSIIRSVKRTSIIVLAVLFTWLSVYPPAPASALPVVGFEAGRIIDDSVFTNHGSMNTGGIQAFLNSKGANCVNGEAPCLKNFAEGGRSAAQIINDTAQEFKINPQVLIVNLQKEVGLVTVSQPGAWRYRTAMGYGCPDSTPNVCNSAYYGFTNQMRWAGRMFRSIMNADPNWSTPYILGNNNIKWHPTNTSCGTSVVFIQNRATQALYNFTPYRPNQAALNAGYGLGDGCSTYGNRNFYLYFTDWFGPTISGRYPSPLFKSESSPTIYAVADNMKYPMANFLVINAYGLLSYPVTVTTDSALSQYTTGPTITSTVAKKRDDPSGTMYLFDDGKRYPIGIEACKNHLDGSPITNTTWGLDCFNQSVSYSLPNSLIDKFTLQDINIPNVILYQDSAWKMEGGKKRRITDPVFIDILGGWGNTRWMKDINAAQPQGKLLIPDNTLVKFDNSPVIYLLVNAQLYPMPGPDEFSAWALGNRKVYSMPASFNASEPLAVNGTNLQFFARNSSNSPFILFNNGQKASVAGQSNWNASTYSELPDYVLNSIPTVSMPPVFRLGNGEIFIVQNDKRRPFPSIDDLIYSGYKPDQIRPVSQLVADKFTYNGLKLSPGRLFKAAGSDAIRYVFDEGASLIVYSSNVPGLPYDKLITVDATTSARYPVIGVY